MPQTNLDALKQEFNDEELEFYWKPIYEKIEDRKVAKKLLRSAEVLQSNRKAHVFCQRALCDLTGAPLRTDGNFSEEVADAINFATRSGLSKQLRMTIAHYAANYVQIKVRKSEYGSYLKKLFE